MGRIENTVFISYRRTNLPWALAIYQNLTAHGYDAFFDYKSINSGDFEQVILGNIKARAHFLVVLTPSALERCAEPNDWLRREIETALNEKRNIVPLFLEGFNFGSPSIAQYLTGGITRLKSYNGLNIPADYFDEAMERLQQKYLNVALEAVLHPISNRVQKVVEQQKIAASDAAQVKHKELSVQEWFEQGYQYGEAKKYDEAIHCYSEAIRLKPDHAESYNNRGTIFEARGDLDSAMNEYDEAIRLKPDLAEAHQGRGTVFKARGDLDSAMNEYDEAIRLKPDLAEAHQGRGSVFEARGNLDSAMNEYDEAIRLKPDLAEAHQGRGTVFKARGNLDSAMKEYNEAIRLKPNLAEAFYNRGIARDDNGDLAGAIKDYTEAIRLKPDFINVFYNRALIWKKKEDYYNAIADYQKYLDLGGGIRDGDQKKVEGFIRDLKNKNK